MPIRPVNPIPSVSSREQLPASPLIVARKRIRAAPPSPPDAPPPERGEKPAAPSLAVAPKRAHHVVDRTGPNWDESGDYIIGKGRPPKHSRWAKGQTGNPRGPKPKEKLDPLAEFERELTADFTARVNGKDVRLNTGTFALQLLKAGAAKGTVKSQQLLLEHFLAAVRKAVDRDDTPEVLAWEQQVIDQMLEAYGLPAKPVVRRERDTGLADNSNVEDGI